LAYLKLGDLPNPLGVPATEVVGEGDGLGIDCRRDLGQQLGTRQVRQELASGKEEVRVSHLAAEVTESIILLQGQPEHAIRRA
jgi:hypothetical protein